VRIEADDDEGRERLVRYCARPCFGLDRLSVLPDGRVAYRIKYGGRGGTHRLLTPIELLARLAALVPPPRHPLLTYHGVLAPHSKWRNAVVPKPPTSAGSQEGRAVPKSTGHGEPGPPTPAPRELKNPIGPRISTPPGPLPTAPCQAKPVAPHSLSSPPVDAPTRAGPTAAAACGQASVSRGDIVITEFGISVRHLDRLLGGLVLATSPRVEWAKLLRRTFAIDALRCPHCAGRLRLLAAITEKATARKILEHLGLPAAPTVPRARSPDQDELSSWMGGAAE